MDNASKAIILAGSVLIAMGLVGLGIYLFRSTGEAVKETASSITSNEIMAINSKFTRYRGECVGVEVKGLIRSVNTHNHISDATVRVNGADVTDASLDRILSEYTETQTYHVDFDYNGAGLITNIKIK